MRDETGVAAMCKIASGRRDTKARRDWEGAVSIGPHITETVASSQCRRVLSPSAIALLSPWSYRGTRHVRLLEVQLAAGTDRVSGGSDQVAGGAEVKCGERARFRPSLGGRLHFSVQPTPPLLPDEDICAPITLLQVPRVDHLLLWGCRERWSSRERAPPRGH